LQQWTVALVIVGLAWRTLRYLLQFPIWGDEAFVCLNFLDQTYLGQLGQLRHSQVAPLLFLWSELTAFRLLGASEWALRLLPFLAGTGALLLFGRLARLTVRPLAATLAVGFLAVAIWPVSMCAFVKPYAFDLLMSLSLLLPAAHWLRQPERWGWLVLLLAVAPVALLTSYPAAFVAGAVTLALLPEVWRRREAKVRVLYAGYNLTMLAGFLGGYLVGAAQVGSAGSAVNTYLRAYWSDAFPPAAPVPLLKWLVLIHTGQLTAYPVGASNGGSTLTFLLCLIGVGQLWKARKRSLVVLLTTPFALGLLAAAGHRYPYGGSCRLAQHLAPSVCLLAGLGAAALIDRYARPADARRRWIAAGCGLLALIGAGGMVRDLVKPYRSQGDLWTYRVAREVFKHAGPADQIVVFNDTHEVKPLFLWYLGRGGKRVSWNGQIDWDRLDTTTPRLWCLRFHPPILRDLDPAQRPPPLPPLSSCARALDGLAADLAQRKRPWVMAARVPYTVVPTDSNGPIERCDLVCWMSPTASPAVPPDAVSCWP
jgi:hypothetical protein